ncbi:MAG: polymer-forming cytoskeletal protein [Anditalea sp.]
MSNKNEVKKSTTEMVTSSNLIAQETSIVGDIITNGNIRVEGKVEGALKSGNKIVIGDVAHVIGDIHALEAEVSGHIDGEIHCSETLYLKRTAYINGDIFAKKLIIENGALFNGKCNMTGQVEKEKPVINNSGEQGKKIVSK